MVLGPDSAARLAFALAMISAAVSLVGAGALAASAARFALAFAMISAADGFFGASSATGGFGATGGLGGTKAFLGGTIGLGAAGVAPATTRSTGLALSGRFAFGGVLASTTGAGSGSGSGGITTSPLHSRHLTLSAVTESGMPPNRWPQEVQVPVRSLMSRRAFSPIAL